MIIGSRAVLKTVVRKRIGGSSPSLGAICLVRRAYGILVSYICSTRLDKHRSSYRTLCIISPICKRLEGSFIGRPSKVYTL